MSKKPNSDKPRAARPGSKSSGSKPTGPKSSASKPAGRRAASASAKPGRARAEATAEPKRGSRSTSSSRPSSGKGSGASKTSKPSKPGPPSRRPAGPSRSPRQPAPGRRHEEGEIGRGRAWEDEDDDDLGFIEIDLTKADPDEEMPDEEDEEFEEDEDDEPIPGIGRRFAAAVDDVDEMDEVDEMDGGDDGERKGAGGRISLAEEDEEDEDEEDFEADEEAPPAPAVREEALPMVAIVGRPNVGKSTLFNRLVGRRDALVHDKPGMTRDRRIQRVQWGNQAFLCVDTGGFDFGIDDPLIQNVAEQAVTAVAEADIIVLLTSRVEFNHPAERQMLDIIRKSGKPTILAVNKCDNHMQEMEAAEFYAYGFEEVVPLSALHGRGVAELVEKVAEKLDTIGPIQREYVFGGIAVAVVGRQNVGKSTLVNRLLGEERVIASDLPGTTRDSIDTTFQTPDGSTFTLIDTAGIRRRGRVKVGVEKISVLSSMISLRRCHVAVLVIDASTGLTAQDAHIAGYCVEQGRSLVIAVNKWDIVEKDSKTADQFTKSLRAELGFLKFAPVVYISAKTGQRAIKLFDIIKMVYANADRRIPTPVVNERFAEWMAHRPPAIKMNRRPKVKYVAQTGTHPPTFTLFVNDPALFHFSYERYLINRLREEYDFSGTPIRFRWRKRGGARKEED